MAEDRIWGLNKERADPALIICLITAAYEGFQTPLQQVLPILTLVIKAFRQTESGLSFDQVRR